MTATICSECQKPATSVKGEEDDPFITMTVCGFCGTVRSILREPITFVSGAFSIDIDMEDDDT